MIKNHIVYNQWDFRVKKALGSFIWDDTGKKLIDFTSGWNVTNLGWNHPEINAAMIAQIKKNTYTSMWDGDLAQEEYAAKLAQILPKNLDTFCRATGGTEANEIALKIARVATGRKKIIGFWNTYHGQSFADITLGFRPEYVATLAPLIPEFIHLDFPSTYISKKSETQILAEFLTKLEDVLQHKDVAAIVTEAGIITGWGSNLVAPKNYLKEVRKLTKQYGTLLILDEVGTGFSRCGKLFGMELENVVPDIVTFAKGISNGAAAIGAVATSQELAELAQPKAKIISTFGWTPVACAAALATLKIHLRDNVWEQAATKGTYLIKELQVKLLPFPTVDAIYGVGMEIGLVFKKDNENKHLEFTQNVIRESYKQGLNLIQADENIIQLMPPLTISKKVLEEGIEILVDAVKLSLV